MTVTVNIPDALAEELRRAPDKDISRQFIEAWAVEAYRTGRASTGKLAKLLNMDRLELVQMLGAAKVFPGVRLDDVEQDASSLDHLLGPAHE